MAGKNVIREDVVQISWDVDDNPFDDLIDEIEQFRREVSNSVDDVADDLDEVERSANEAANEIGDIGREASEAARDARRLTNELRDIDDIRTDDVLDPLDDDIDRTERNSRTLFQRMRDGTQQIKEGFQEAGKKVTNFFQTLADGNNDVEKLQSGFDTLFDKIGTGLAAAGIAMGTGEVVSGVNDMQSALNHFQAKTGANAKEMETYAYGLKSLYTDNMGESFEDVADAMATVKNNTKFADEEVAAITNDALTLRDTFDFEVLESVRSVQMMMDQFGISGMEAYNLITQGAQNGLNKNDDLLDTINEYSVHFKQLGFGADEMFNMLANGASSGTFSVDKLGDAMKEFGIRAIDGSKTTVEGFQAIGLDADKMAKKFKAGGETGKQAFMETVTALKNMKDPIAQNTAGVNLFGTMWEDLGAEGVFALANVNGSIDITTDKLEELENIKYDDAGSALASLGRTVNVELADSVGEGVNKVKEKIPEIKEGISDLFAGLRGEETNGTVFGTIGESLRKVGEAIKFVVDNANIFVPIIGTLVGAFMTYKTIILAVNTATTIYNTITAIQTAYSAIKAGVTLAEAAATTTATGAQVGLNAALLACPITWIIIAIVAVIGIVWLLIANWDKIKEVAAKVWEKICEIWGKVADWFSKNVIEPVVNFFKGLWDKVTEIFTSVVNWVKDNFKSIILFIINPFAGVFSYLYNNFEGFRNFVDGIVGAVKTFFMNCFYFIAGLVITVWNTISGVLSTVGMWIYTNIITPIVNFFLALWTRLVGIVTSIIAGIKAVWITIITWINTYIITPIVNFFVYLWSNIMTGVNNAVSFIRQVWSLVVTWINTYVITPIVTFFTNLWTKITEIVNSVKETITTIWGTISSWVSENIIEPIKGFFKGLWDKITEGVDTVKKSITDAFTSAFDKVKEVWNGITGFFSDLWDGIKDTVNNLINKGKEAIGISDDVNDKKDNGTKHALGGLMTSRHIGVVAEAGPEMIIPLTKSKRKDALDMWSQTGEILGVGSTFNAEIPQPKVQLSNQDLQTTSPTINNASTSSNNFDINLTINVDGRGNNDRELARLISKHVKEVLKEASESFNRKNPRLTEA